MEKAILMSIRPQYVAQILKGNKIIEVRKKFPKDYVGWVYIYCTKHKLSTAKYSYLNDSLDYNYAKKIGLVKEILNGKVVAKFWCDKVEKIVPYKHFTNDCDYNYHYRTYDVSYEKLLDYTCLCNDELDNYLDANTGYALHVAKGKVEIFEKPKELKEFKVYDKTYDNVGMWGWAFSEDEKYYPLKRAPQSWCYIYE